jgi:E3 ubiquitin-protein ligase RNF14
VECPGCRSNITKRSGCDHMTCKFVDLPLIYRLIHVGRCGFEFCYKCQAPYKGTQGIRRVGNSAHKEGCPYHSSKLPRYQGAIY